MYVGHNEVYQFVPLLVGNIPVDNSGANIRDNIILAVPRAVWKVITVTVRRQTALSCGWRAVQTGSRSGCVGVADTSGQRGKPMSSGRKKSGQRLPTSGFE